MNAGARPMRAIVLCLAMLAGCQRAELTLEPAVLEDCGPGPGKVVRVAWNAAEASPDGVAVELLRPGGDTVPWTRSRPVGEKSTGPWGSDGLTFILRAADGRELARRTVTTVPCREGH